jgi:hypothetical protein
VVIPYGLCAENVYSFDGSENMVRVARTYNIQFLCTYNLKWYPFDTQVNGQNSYKDTNQ